MPFTCNSLNTIPSSFRRRQLSFHSSLLHSLFTCHRRCNSSIAISDLCDRRSKQSTITIPVVIENSCFHSAHTAVIHSYIHSRSRRPFALLRSHFGEKPRRNKEGRENGGVGPLVEQCCTADVALSTLRLPRVAFCWCCWCDKTAHPYSSVSR